MATIIDSEFISKLIFRKFDRNNRFTQDSPIYPDVWLEYFEHIPRESLATYRCDVILMPHRRATSAELLQELFKQFKKETPDFKDNIWHLASTGESVAAKLTLKELITVILPLTEFGQQLISSKDTSLPSLIWLQELVGAILLADDGKVKEINAENNRDVLKKRFAASGYLKLNPKAKHELPIIYSVSKNRRATIAIDKSVPSTKADAGRRVFDIDGSFIAWAVLDTGIDARHYAFRKTDPKRGQPFKNPMETKTNPLSNNTRVVATYDFTKFRDILVNAASGKKITSSVTSSKHNKKLDPKEVNDLINDAQKDLTAGRLLDWSVIAPLLRVPHNKEEYKVPGHSHGSHVAGIIGAGSDGKNGSEKLTGMCPKIDLYDIRVMDDNGEGDEFNIIAALQFVRWMNTQRDGIIIHGINLSLSLKHEVASYGCGQTPICQACERLVAEGTVVVAAAGNFGQSMFDSPDGGGSVQGFRMVNITDPGNAESIITVGSTHSNRPHSYGVSYFSSKGPTGDGRLKPDLVAPGEKINSTCIGDSTEVRDGTSMAAPHVSGAAALLLAKHRELIGKPARVKQILCDTATDLGREKYFQGSGMIDVLRAIQSV
jgi:serine protease AprX